MLNGYKVTKTGFYKVKILKDKEESAIADVLVEKDGRSISMLGSAGADREIALAESYISKLKPDQLPVLIGSGAGFALELLASYCQENKLALLVVDYEEEILKETKLPEKYKNDFVSWIRKNSKEDNASVAKRQITLWQKDKGNKALAPLCLPFYRRIDRDFYSALQDSCEASKSFDFWSKAKYKKFTTQDVKILLLTSKYFLMGEVEAACERLGIEVSFVTLPEKSFGQNEFIELILKSVIDFKPDFIFTINHLGIDREGVLVNLLAELELPIASWFVDNPHLILSYYTDLVNPWTAIFTWDVDNLEPLRELGFDHVHYLPLGTDHKRFIPKKSNCPRDFKAGVSFVGNSMVYKVDTCLKRYKGPKYLIDNLESIAHDFRSSDKRYVTDFVKSRDELYNEYNKISGIENRMNFDSLLTWEATRQYRLDCVSSIFPYEPLIVGDDGWDELIPKKYKCHRLSEITYYTDLPNFYPCSQINFNCTSQQMKGAVNQRVFDVPATESFLLTDYREQVENLFEMGKEIICYKSPEEAKDLVKYYLDHPEEGKKIAKAARKRVLKEHTYEHRVQELIKVMRHFFS